MNSIGHTGLFIDRSNSAERALTDARRQPVADLRSEAAADSVSISKTATSGVAQQQVEKLESSARDLLDIGELRLPGKADLLLFERDFNSALAKAGVDTSIEIELETDYQGKVQVSNDHPDKEKIEQLFEDDADLQQQFVKAQMFQTFEKLAALHKQWQQRIESGESEETANLWLVQASQALVANDTSVTFQEGRVSSRGLNQQNEGAMQVIANLQALNLD